MSAFSSWGLAPDLSIKPDLSAPGGQIYSTFPTNRGSYATLSSSVPFNIYNTTALDSVARQGGGLIDAYRALRITTKVSPQQLQLGDLAHASPNNEYTFTIHNNGRMAADYTITHRASGTAQGYKNKDLIGSQIPMKKPDLLLGHQVEAIIESITPEKVTVPINGASNVTVRIKPPENYTVMPPSIYSGFFVVTKDNDPYDILHVPYAGLTSTLGDLPVLYINETMPEVLVNRVVGPLSPALIRLQLIHPSPLVLVTALDEFDRPVGIIPGGYWSFVGRHDIGNNNDALMMTWNGDIAATPEQAMAVQSKSSSTTVDLAVNYPALFRAMDHHDIETEQQEDRDGSDDTANLEYHSQSIKLPGKPLPRGVYKLKVMVLHAFGDYQNMADYDTWTSQSIYVA
ncbi:hypothetical protein BDB00DRAFT_902278 [Zychaea mexicana]|uniref:uncharacterized protein n=1 Tax=Zychaea mexicana TaxID=64656 RepID=UPI0022FE312B|nr:uncharacterized protein BDB00DRAFT_902278 [Zychaea mexicana]KAI9467880.1 hypothetical protein BDB00DRAFT_902278 [Zychaea mexicana]